MNHFTPFRPAFDFSIPLPGAPTPGCVPAPQGCIEASQFLEMETSFRSQGGMAGSDQVAELLSRRTDQPISKLARWIVDRDVLSVSWRSRLVLPLFQFDLTMMMPRGPVREVIRGLAPVLGDWALALWFARRNDLLRGVAPVDVIVRDPWAVFDAARQERLLLQPHD